MMNKQKDRLSYRVLIIDDNPSIHEDFKKILTNQDQQEQKLLDIEASLFGPETPAPTYANFEIDCSFQGKDGAEMAKKAQAEGRPYALAFVDGRIPPGWDGIETINHLWRTSPELQVVYCTAYSDYSLREIHQVLGMNDSLLILKKPFDNVEVLQMAHALTCKWSLNQEIHGRLNQLAYYDSLTGLPNRVLFLKQFSQVIEKARRHGNCCALLFLDMDNFKRINDTLGHTFGDKLLKITAKRLAQSLRASDKVSRPLLSGLPARLGGDEFIALLPELKKEADAVTVANRISKFLSMPITIGNHEVTVTPSIGIALFPKDGDNVEKLLKNADFAMYFAKRSGANMYKFYEESMNTLGLKCLNVESHLRHAIERNELFLHYQPQFDLSTGRLSGMEALLRWNNIELGQVQPSEFIPVAEESGLIISIGEWVLKTACQQTVEWLNNGLSLPRMAVNVSVKQLAHPGFINIVQKILAETGLDPQRLEIEITENLLANNLPVMLGILKTLKKLRVRIAVDDFGNGYSSLNRLKELPIDCLKIDRSFVSGLGINITDQSIISAIIRMADGMNLTVIAEGVETDEQKDFLNSKKCQYVQGYLFSRPLSAEKAEKFLRDS